MFYVCAQSVCECDTRKHSAYTRLLSKGQVTKARVVGVLGARVVGVLGAHEGGVLRTWGLEGHAQAHGRVGRVERAGRGADGAIGAADPKNQRRNLCAPGSLTVEIPVKSGIFDHPDL